VAKAIDARVGDDKTYKNRSEWLRDAIRDKLECDGDNPSMELSS